LIHTPPPSHPGGGEEISADNIWGKKIMKIGREKKGKMEEKIKERGRKRRNEERNRENGK
jgi:hypothetical protein